MSEFIRDKKVQIPRKAVATLVAVGMSVGLSSCGPESKPNEHEPATSNKLTKIIKPKLNDLGELAICLSKEDGSIVSRSNEGSVDFDARRLSSGQDGLEYEFAVEMGFKPGTHQADPNKTLSATIGSGDLPGGYGGYGEFDTLTLLAPGEPGNPSEGSYYVEDYTYIGADYPAELQSTNPSTPNSYSIHWSEKGKPTAVTTARNLTSNANMDYYEAAMRIGVSKYSEC